MQNISEENICDISNEINSITIRPNSAEEHSIYVEIEIETTCSAYEKREVSLIQDLYSPTANIHFSQKRVSATADKTTKIKNFTVTSKTNIPELADGTLLDAVPIAIINKEQITKDKVIYEGEMAVNFIFTNANNNVNSKMSKIPFEFTVQNPMENENINVDTKLNVIGKETEVKQNGDIDCIFDLEAQTEFSQNVGMNVIDNIEIAENDADSGDYDSLIIYIVQKGDTLWKIAKKFRSTVDDIARVNGIENADKIVIGQKLYIPKFKYIRRSA